MKVGRKMAEKAKQKALNDQPQQKTHTVATLTMTATTTTTNRSDA